MKTNTPKRKIFADAVDMLTEDMEAKEMEKNNGVSVLSVEKIKPFHDHPFRLYEGERLQDMVESIREHGILNPVIVRKLNRGYEMLAGHNRLNAAKLAGLAEIPAIVKTELSDEEAYIYVIETNVMQRSFTDLLPSEKAAVLSERYEKVCGTKKRDEILEELNRLNGMEEPKEVGGHDVHQNAKSREIVGHEYGMTGRNIARYIRVNKLLPYFKELLDDGKLALVLAVELSYLKENEQEQLEEIMREMVVKLNGKNVKLLKEQSGELTKEKILELLGNSQSEKKKSMNVKISTDVYEKYFSQTNAKDVNTIIEKALEAWFQKEGADV